MKKFFENYGLIALASIVVIVLIIIATPIGGSIESATTSIVDSFAGNVNNSIITNVVTAELKPNDMIELAGKKYVVLGAKGANRYLIMDIDGINENAFDLDSNIYEGSDIDIFLNEEYYNSLSFKEAIIPHTFTANFYKLDYRNPEFRTVSSSESAEYNGCQGACILQPDGKWISANDHEAIKGKLGAYRFLKASNSDEEGNVVNTITRNVFLPTMEMVSSIVNFEDQYEVTEFIKSSSNRKMWISLANGSFDWIKNHMIITNLWYSPSTDIHERGNCVNRPTFVIDLSKVEYINLNQQFIK